MESRNAKQYLEELLYEDKDLRTFLLPIALEVAVGNSFDDSVVKDVEAYRKIVNLSLDLIEEDICQITRMYQELHLIRACEESSWGWSDFIKICKELSGIYEVLCRRYGLSCMSFASVCGEGPLRLSPVYESWYEAMLEGLPCWISGIAEAAQGIDREINGEGNAVGQGYITNCELFDSNIVPATDTESKNRIREYEECGLPPCIMIREDFVEVLRGLISGCLGARNSTDHQQTTVSTFLFECTEFDAELDGSLVSFLIPPVERAKMFYMDYGSSVKRWVLDLPRLNEGDVQTAISAVKCMCWEKPSFKDIAKRGSMW